MKIGQLVVLVDDVDGVRSRPRRLHHGYARRDGHGRLPIVRTLALGPSAPWQVLPRELFHRLSAREAEE